MLLPIVFRLRGGDDDTRTKRERERERLSLQKEEDTIETTVIISERRVVEANDYELKERKDHFYHFPLWTQFFATPSFSTAVLVQTQLVSTKPLISSLIFFVSCLRRDFDHHSLFRYVYCTFMEDPSRNFYNRKVTMNERVHAVNTLTVLTVD